MARLVTKFKYIKPNAKSDAGRYAKYIATREGVEKLDDTQGLAPVTLKQQKFIEKLLHDFPDSAEMLEYTDYVKNGTVSSASEFISRALEDNAFQIMQTKTYADYIATRPRAERFGTHGLFTDDGVKVSLTEVSDELKKHEGNVWTMIVSLRREDAQRLGFNTGTRWRDMLRTQTNAIANNLKIPVSDFKWYAAFHNESHHPHIHLIAYSDIVNDGFLTKKGIDNIRSSLARSIFAQDNIEIYKRQTEYRDTLRQSSREIIADIIGRINAEGYDNPKVEELFLHLADKLANYSGKKQYGYLKPELKSVVDAIVDELSADERIKELYDLWYEQRFEILRNYTDEMPSQIPLSQNEEFKPVRNAVIEEAMNIVLDRQSFEDDDITDEQQPEPTDTETESAEPPPPPDEYERLILKPKKNKWDKYHLAKICLDKESAHYNVDEAVEWLISSAQDNYTVAQYKLGKMFLRGEGVTKDVPYAFRWLEEAEKQNNSYAQYLLGKTYLKGEDVPKDIDKAVELLEKSANQHNKYAAYTLGKLYLDGKDVPTDIEKALNFLKASADRGFEAAEYVLGKLLLSGDSAIRNPQKAVEYLTRAAGKGNPFAQYLLGKFYLTDEDMPKDIDRAVWYLEQSAEQGNQWAQFALGKLYLYGSDVEQDTEKAIVLLTASAEQGNAYAANMLKSYRHHKNYAACMGVLRLFNHMSRIIQNKLEDDRRGGRGITDRKIRRVEDEKRQAHGQRLE
ncbi:MAG: MobP3 family relaxase [Eubacteriales bacterium]|nr:MobP3 family relaxase [Eubacteriales bacterium]